MLAYAIAGVAIVMLAANAILSAGILTERIVVRRSAQEYAALEYSRAAGRLFTALSGYMRNGSLPSPLPPISPLPAQCAGETCSMTAGATITLLRADSDAMRTCDAGLACAANEQTNPNVREGRVVARIAVDVRASGGTLLAHRENDVTLRTFASAPYVAIAGAMDRTVDARETSHGEDAGTIPPTPNPCGAVVSGESSDTVVRVMYKDAQTGTCTDGSSWRTTGY